jgi:hypothetical protein
MRANTPFLLAYKHDLSHKQACSMTLRLVTTLVACQLAFMLRRDGVGSVAHLAFVNHYLLLLSKHSLLTFFLCSVPYFRPGDWPWHTWLREDEECGAEAAIINDVNHVLRFKWQRFGCLTLRRRIMFSFGTLKVSRFALKAGKRTQRVCSCVCVSMRFNWRNAEFQKRLL